ncbi:hypothetical protein [Georgenia subflava]|uniref:ABC transporter ATP-binding protein n=1 Tax=Georgenia subflava TaxID=1622177 RepID=A0A6N7EJ01_9MICO|nr:hypothetical protein [Georgenia subflava]MPV36998.1 hypothetical protein [Georgenia subflava]
MGSPRRDPSTSSEGADPCDRTLTEALELTDAAVVVASHDRQLLHDVAHWPHLALAAPATEEAGVDPG